MSCRRIMVLEKVAGILQRALAPELAEDASLHSDVWAVQASARQTLESVGGETAKAKELVETLCELARCCISLAREASLANLHVAELVGESLAVAAFLFASEEEAEDSEDENIDRLKYKHRAPIARFLEPLGEALDGFTVEIFESLRRLEVQLKPEWEALPGGGQGGRIVLGNYSDASALQLYEAQQAICVWSLAIAVRGVGHYQFSSVDLWAFASGDVFTAFVFARAALSFHQGDWSSASTYAPEEVAHVREAVLRGVLGACSQDVAFIYDDDVQNGDIPISVRNDQLLTHKASIAASLGTSGLLDCLLFYRWAQSPHLVPALASFLSDLVNSSDLPNCSIVLICLKGQVEAFKESLSLKSKVLWTILIAFVTTSRSFLRDCAVLSGVAPPPDHELCNTFTDLVTSDTQILGDCTALASLVVIAANAMCHPGQSRLSAALAHVGCDVRERLASQLWKWKGANSVLREWLKYVNVPQPVREDALAPAEAPPTEPASNLVQAKQATGLRAIFFDAPTEFRCAADGAVLVDPVRSPAGYVFERSVLARYLQASGGLCPLTQVPLTLAECTRDIALRKQIMAWVRETRSRENLPREFIT